MDQIAQLFKALPVEEQQTALKRFQDVLGQLQSTCSNSEKESPEKQPDEAVQSEKDVELTARTSDSPEKHSSVEERLGKLEEQLDQLKKENANLKGTVLQQYSPSRTLVIL